MQRITLLKENFVLGGLIIMKFALQFLLVNPQYELHRDEFLHIDQGKHLALGYLSVPPFTSWISALIILLGKGIFWVKFFPALFGVLTMVLVWKIIKDLDGSLFAMCLGAVAVLCSSILRLNILYQPNSADVFFWTLLYFFIIRYAKSENSKWLYCAALALGFGFLNKYNIAFLALGLFPALILSPYRKIFSKKEFYLAILLAFLVVAPNLYWQYENSFPVIHHMKELSATQLVNVSRTDFLKEQLFFFINSFFLIILAFVGLLLWPRFKKYRFLVLSFVITMSLFVGLKAKGYYAIGIYPVFLAFGSVYLEHLINSKKVCFLRPIAFIVILVPFWFIIQIAFPVHSPQEVANHHEKYQKLGLLRWEDGKDHQLPQDYADMIGWKELASVADAAYADAGNGKTLVLCDNYGQAGAINYYTKLGIQAVSMNADYIDWISLKNEYKNVVLVQESGDDDQERKKEQPLFHKIKKIGGITNTLSREYGTTVYLLTDAKVSIRKLIRQEILDRKTGD